MFKKSLLLILLMAVFAPWAANAQTTVEIGDGTVTCNTNPIGTYYNYSITEQLYTAEEIGMAGTISSISFYYKGTAAKDLPITVYMKHVDEGDLASGGISLADADEVFTGTLSVTTTAGWVTIELDTPFAYDGTSNLLIGCIKGYLYYFSGQTWQGTATTSTMARYTQNDNNEYTTSTVPGTAQTNRPNIQLVITAGSGSVCEKPETMEASDVTANSATLTWTGGSGTYNVEYKGGSAEDWTAYLTNTTATTANLTGLTPGTNYQYRVQSVCGDQTSSWKSVSFQTLFGIPLVEEFGTTIPTGWAQYTGLLENVMDGTADLTAATYGWSFGTSSNGVFDEHARVNIYGTSCMRWLVLPTLAMENNVQLMFDVAYTAYSGTGAPATDGTDDKFVVLINNGGNWEILRQWDNAGSEYVLNDLNTTPLTVALDLSSYAGNNIAVAFYAESTESNADNNLHIDNVSIDYIPACPKPLALAVNYEGNITATVTWESNAAGFEIDYNGTQITGITGNSYELTGLELATEYEVKVRANCGTDGFSEWTDPVSFTTNLCMDENMCELTFVLTDSYGDGWNGAYIDVVDVATGESLAHMSNQNLSKGDPETETYTLTVCDGRELQFVWYSGSYDSEASYVVTDINGEEIFSGSGAMSEPVNYTVNCTVNPCRVPTDLAASEISTFKADLSWTGYHDAYNLQYRRPAAADPTATTATVILTAGDVWGDGSGYQMLLDADATAYGTIIPEIGSYGYISADGTIGGSTGDVSEEIYAEFEYKIPVSADGALATDNIVINDTITIQIPAGIYDWCITNPTSGDRMWIASSNGNVGGRYDDFVFEAGMTYEFTVSMHGENDGVEVTITPMDEWIFVENLTDPSYNLTGLDAKTMYEWQVQGISDDCENGVTEWSAISSFFTDKAYYWNDPQTWTNDSVPAAYEDVTIPANTTVVIPDGCTAIAGEITIEEGGQIIIESGGQLFHSNEIPVTVQLDINGSSSGAKEIVPEWHLIASPINESVSVASTGLVSDEFVYDLYYFDQAGDEMGYEWINYYQGPGLDPGFTELYIKKGYLYHCDTIMHAEFTGSTLPTNAPVSVELDYVEDKAFSGWNLVGNPFTSLVEVDRDFYTLNAGGDEIIAATNNTVEVTEGIFVEAESAGETVTFTPVICETTGEIGGEPYEEPTDKGNLVLNITVGSNLLDRAIVHFDEGRNLSKFQLNPNHTKVYITMDNKDYAVVHSESVGELPVSFKAESNGTYNMSFAAEKVSFNYLHLIDNMTGADVDLLVNPSYSFKANTTDYASRFKLVFATGDNSNDNNFAFFSNGNFVINNDGEATLQVVDVMGRIIKSETINGSASVSVNVATGVYMLRLINGNDVKVQKVVVR